MDDVDAIPHSAALAALLEASSEGVVFQDAAGRIVAASRRAQDILGLSDAALRGQTLGDRAPLSIREDGRPFPDDEHPATVTLRTGAPQRDVIMGIRQPDGDLRWITVSSHPVHDGGRLVGVVTAFTDFTDRRRLVDLLRRQALTDSLTGLGNRRAFDDRLTAEFSRARRHDHPIALALFDVDGFKRLNDRFGHPEGDRALLRIGDALQRSVRAEDFAARLAGDEFAVVLPEATLTTARPILDRIATQIAEDDLLRSLGVAVSAGLAEARKDDGAEALYRAADAALYDEKRRRQGGAGGR